MNRKRSVLFLSLNAADLFQKYSFFSDLLHKLLHEGCMVSLEYLSPSCPLKEGSKLTQLEEVLIFSGLHHDKILVDQECLEHFGGCMDRSILENRPTDVINEGIGFDELFYKCFSLE